MKRENNKNVFFARLQESKRKQMVFCMGAMCLILSVYFLIKCYGIDRMLEIKEDDFSWVYQVDEVNVDGKYFVLQGFAFELEKNSKEGAFELVLQDIATGKLFFPKMEYMEREDVNAYFLCEYDYLQSGFKATINASKLDLYEKNYEVLLKKADNHETFRTGTYLSEGQLLCADPAEFEPLDLIGTDLEKIVENGVLRAFQSDFGIYVYQCGWDLYWIIASNYEFDSTGNMYMDYQLDTTQIEKLPTYRLENHWYWSNLGFWFCSKELSKIDTGEYRVAKTEIPTEYSVVKIWTGEVHDWEWIWKLDFRPNYLFSYD